MTAGDDLRKWFPLPPAAAYMSLMDIEEITDNFALLDDWEDRYRYLIELGRLMPPFPEQARIDANKVQGCASQVWLSTRWNRDRSRASASSATATPTSSRA